MRNPKRLDEFYSKLCSLHKNYVPDLRFGQMIYNLIKTDYYDDIFYLEEDEMLEKIEEYLKELNKQ